MLTLLSGGASGSSTKELVMYSKARVRTYNHRSRTGNLRVTGILKEMVNFRGTAKVKAIINPKGVVSLKRTVSHKRTVNHKRTASHKEMARVNAIGKIKVVLLS
jgi:hypothetical protein